MGERESVDYDKRLRERLTRETELLLIQYRLETDLRRAVERKEFLSHHKLIVQLETGRTSGYESLNSSVNSISELHSIICNTAS